MLNACVSLCTWIRTLSPFLFPSPSLVEGIGDLQSKYCYRVQKCKISYSSSVYLDCFSLWSWLDIPMVLLK